MTERLFFNGCDSSAVEGLRYIVKNGSPSTGGESLYNMMHLDQIADELERSIKTVKRIVSDQEYMLSMYFQLMGPKARELAILWKQQGVQKVHVSWGPSGGELTGEDRAEILHKIIGVVSKEMPSIDSHIQTQRFTND